MKIDSLHYFHMRSSKLPSCAAATSNKIKEFILLTREDYLIVKMQNEKVLLDYIK